MTPAKTFTAAFLALSVTGYAVLRPSDAPPGISNGYRTDPRKRRRQRNPRARVPALRAWRSRASASGLLAADTFEPTCQVQFLAVEPPPFHVEFTHARLDFEDALRRCVVRRV